MRQYVTKENAVKLLNYLWKTAEETDEHWTHIDNTEGFMYLNVELISENEISIAHYGKCNGDLVADPEMVFHRDANGNFWPIFYQNDYMGIYWQSMIYDPELKLLAVAHEQMHDDQVSFFEDEWAENIIWQQQLEDKI